MQHIMPADARVNALSFMPGIDAAKSVSPSLPLQPVQFTMSHSALSDHRHRRVWHNPAPVRNCSCATPTSQANRACGKCGRGGAPHDGGHCGGEAAKGAGGWGNALLLQRRRRLLLLLLLLLLCICL